MRAAQRVAVAEPSRQHQVLDMRLVPAALGCWAATLVALTLGWWAGLVLAISAVVVAIGSWVVLLWATAHRRERWRVVAVAGLATLLLTAGFGAAAAWREHQVQAHPLRESFGRTVHVVAVIEDDAKLIRASSFGGQRRWIVRAGLLEFRSGQEHIRAGGALIILAEDDAWAELSPGQVVRFRARVSEPTRADLTVAAVRAVARPERVGMPPWWQRLATDVRADLAVASARALPPAAAGLLPALVVGDTAALSAEVRDAFEIAGLQHLCVVSGANFTILLTALLALTRVLTAGPRTSAAAAAGAVVVFVILARPDPSVLRAAAMGSVTVLALLTGRRKQAVPALCGAVLGLLAVAPQLAVSAGFALSVLATAGLILLAPSWADWLRARGWWQAPAEIVAVSAAAFVVTLPLMVALSGRVSLVAIAANALVAPVVGMITVIGAAGTVVACLWSDAAVWVLWCARPPLWWLLGVADHAAAIPGAMITVRSGMASGLSAAAMVIVVVAALRWSTTRRLITVVVLGIAVVLVPVRLWQPGWPPAGWVLAMCDVGQGDGLALAVGPGTAVVIDTGPDPRPIRRCLDRLHVNRISLLILTHPHADHIDGLSGAIRGRTVDAIATAPGELRPARPCPRTPPAQRSTAPSPGPTPPLTPPPSSSSGALPPGALPPGALPPGALPPNTLPLSAPPPGTPPSQPSQPAGMPGPTPSTSPSPGVLTAEASTSVDNSPPSTIPPMINAAPNARTSAAQSPALMSFSSRSAEPEGPCLAERAGGDDPEGTDAGHSSAHEGGGVERVAELAEAARIPLLELHDGHVLSFGATELMVLAPSREVPESLTPEEANDRSLVVLARTAVGTVLLTGDIEADAQARLLRDNDLRADILKVPHHGSRTTTPEFLRAVHPRLALVSSGADNTFGHPHADITAVLTQLGATIARTDRDGDVIVFGSGVDLRTVTSRRR